MYGYDFRQSELSSKLKMKTSNLNKYQQSGVIPSNLRTRIDRGSNRGWYYKRDAVAWIFLSIELAKSFQIDLFTVGKMISVYTSNTQAALDVSLWQASHRSSTNITEFVIALNDTFGKNFSASLFVAADPPVKPPPEDDSADPPIKPPPPGIALEEAVTIFGLD